jgi:hypothetical protein
MTFSMLKITSSSKSLEIQDSISSKLEIKRHTSLLFAECSDFCNCFAKMVMLI